jgi:hypothetical protein
MKKTIVLILCLAFFSLACLQTVVVAQVAPTGTNAARFVTTLTPALSPKGEGVTPTRPSKLSCARVIAIEALHMRQGANENAVVLAWLVNGEVVRVVDRSDGDWWFIEHAGVYGYARSVYLELFGNSKSKCE